MGDLYALSLLQPWVWCVAEGLKPVENRKWRPPTRMLGQRFALHASAGFDEDAVPFVRQVLAGLGSALPASVQRSAIVGTARLVGAVQIAEEEDPHRARQLGLLMSEFDGEACRAGQRGAKSTVLALTRDQAQLVRASPWTFGPWAWLLEDVEKLSEPVPCKGALGFWKVPEDLAATVEARRLERQSGVRS